MPVLREFKTKGQPTKYLFYCPGCKSHMWFRTSKPAEEDGSGVWAWNGSFDKPTVQPSLLVSTEGAVCHVMVVDGKLNFLNDCQHEYAGKVIPMASVEL